MCPDLFLCGPTTVAISERQATISEDCEGSAQVQPGRSRPWIHHHRPLVVVQTPQFRSRASLLARVLPVGMLHDRSHIQLDRDRFIGLPNALPSQHMVHGADIRRQISRVRRIPGTGWQICAENWHRPGEMI